MGCTDCDKRKCIKDIGRSCCFCTDENNETGVEICQGGSKLNVYDWLEGMPANLGENLFEVRFKNTRKGYYLNATGMPLERGDIVAVEAAPGHDIGIVSLGGDLVFRQMRRTGFNPAGVEFKKIYRKAKPYDIEKWQEAIGLEHTTMIRSRQIAADLGLNMKIGDVEYQGDKLKAIFYYIADERVDFRELIKILADRFKIRIEMKQIGTRQEAGRIGGIGSCGRELCCASWISSFVSVTTNSARVQEISLNPQKLAGQCSKLKCCLVYELDAYVDARKEFPRIHAPLETLDGLYYLSKIDIFDRTMWFSSDPHSMAALVPLSIERAREVIAMNKRGKKPDRLEDQTTLDRQQAEQPDFRSAVGEESITRFDKAKREQRGRGRGRGRSNGAGNGNGTAGEQSSQPQTPRSNSGNDGRGNGNGGNNKNGGQRPPHQGGGSQNPGRAQGEGGQSGETPSKRNNRYNNRKTKNEQ